MRQATALLSIRTERQGLLEITDRICEWTDAQAVREGLLTIFCRHTSASLLIQENAASAVRSDLEAYFARLAPEDPSAYIHDDEGPDDMPAHIRTALTQVALTIPLIGGPADARHLAGHLPVRASAAPAHPYAGAAPAGGVRRR